MDRSKRLRIRLARLDDAADISAVHCSHVPRWYRVLDSEQIEVGYDDLSIEERWGFGGPWMSTETCAIHLNGMLQRRQLPYVAEIDGQVVGETEVFVGREGKRYGLNCHVGLLYVRSGDRGTGVGSELIRHAGEIAAEKRCDTLTVSAMPENEAFYQRRGFVTGDTLVEVSAPVRHYPVEVTLAPPPISRQSYAWGMDMPLGRLQSSAYHLFELDEDIALPASANLEKHAAYLKVAGHKSMIAWVTDSREEAQVYAWSAGASARDLAMAAMQMLEKAGIDTARILLSRKDYKLLSDEIDTRIIGTHTPLITTVL